MRSIALLGACLLAGAASAMAQTAPPIHGVTGTIATDATIRDEHEAANKIAVGIKKILPGGQADENPLDGFTEGRKVILKDADGTTEGVVIDVNRRKQQFTVRISQKKTETLRVLQPGGQPDVNVSYTDPAGAKVERGFARVS